MCTLTFVPTKDGFVVGMNRDEKRVRRSALHPKRFEFPSTAALYPHESSGGSWIACNNHGTCLALLNRNVDSPISAKNARSRGVLIPDLIGESDLRDTRTRYAQLDLTEILPFRLVGVFPKESVVTEWRWDGLRREELNFEWRKRHWFSSSLSDALAERGRGRTCEKATSSLPMSGVSWVRGLHESHDPIPGPFSICVHREDAATVSYTEVHCTEEAISMSYRDGCPCAKERFDTEASLDLGVFHGSQPVETSQIQP